MGQMFTFLHSLHRWVPVVPMREPARSTGSGARKAYLSVLTWAFTLFSLLRVVAYLPTMWAIQLSGDSSQHSVWTWCTWLGAHLTMAAWLYEQDGQRIGRAAVVCLGNAAMCVIITGLILVHRV